MNKSRPDFFDSENTIIPRFELSKREVWPSKMFTIKLELKEFEKNNPGVPVYDASQGDGGASLGGIPKAELVRALNIFLPDEQTTMYGTPVGRADVRKAIFENYHKLDDACGLDSDNIIIGEGGRDLSGT